MMQTQLYLLVNAKDNLFQQIINVYYTEYTQSLLSKQQFKKKKKAICIQVQNFSQLNVSQIFLQSRTSTSGMRWITDVNVIPLP